MSAHAIPSARLAALAVGTLLCLSAPARAVDEAAPAAAPVAPREVLLGDFIEVGSNPAGVSRDLALVEMRNRTRHAVDLAFGEGTARLAPEERLLLRVPPGEIPLVATADGRPDLRLEGRVVVERARRYAIDLAVGAPQPEEAARAPQDGVGRSLPEAPGEGQGQQAASGSAAEAVPAQHAKSSPAAEKARKTGHVDIGRKRKRDRQ